MAAIPSYYLAVFAGAGDDGPKGAEHLPVIFDPCNILISETSIQVYAVILTLAGSYPDEFNIEYECIYD